jgi:hypothetical protein
MTISGDSIDGYQESQRASRIEGCRVSTGEHGVNIEFALRPCAALALVSCAGGANAPGASDADSGAPGVFVSASTDDAKALPSCGAGTTQPYVLSDEGILYTFDPPTRAFAKIGPLSCWAPGMTANSMAVDRTGTAWVDFQATASDGTITGGGMFRASTADGTCEPAAITLPRGWQSDGMAFATVSGTDADETLYVAGATNLENCGAEGGPLYGSGLGVASSASGGVSPVGPFSGDLLGQRAELTGTGDGRLYGFFDMSPARVALLDTHTGATSQEVMLPGIDCPTSWAFSFWGGDLYLYTAASPTAHSSVARYSIANGVLDASYMADAGINIVGAGVSTCAPTAPPTR